MIIYEVTAIVEQSAASDYRQWLYEHVAAMLRFDGFERATISELLDTEAESQGFVISYYLRDSDSLDHYIANNAPAMRADGERLFGGRFKATRRVLSLIVELNAETS